MHNATLLIIMRYLHIVCAVVAVGGMSFMLLCVLPAAKPMEDEQRKALITRIHHRFTRVVWACIAGLIISGGFNWIASNDDYTHMGFTGQGLLGIKVLLAVVIFAIVWARSAGLLKADEPRSARRILMINIHLAAIVILLAAIVRYFHVAYLQHIVVID